MKKLGYLLMLLCFLPLLLSSTPTEAKEASIVIDGQRLQDASVLSKEGSLYLPLRKMGEALGAKVDYQKSEGANPVGLVRLSSGGNEIELVLDNYSFVSKNNEIFILPQFPLEKNGVSYLPLRAVGELFGYELKWSNQTKTVSINTKLAKPTSLKKADFSFNTLLASGGLKVGSDGKYHLDLSKSVLPKNERYQYESNGNKLFYDYWTYLRYFKDEAYGKALSQFLIDGLNRSRLEQGLSPFQTSPQATKAVQQRTREVKKAFSNLPQIKQNLKDGLSTYEANGRAFKKEREGLVTSSTRPNGKNVYTVLEEYGLSYQGAFYDYFYNVNSALDALNFLAVKENKPGSPYYSSAYKTIAMDFFADKEVPYLFFAGSGTSAVMSSNVYGYVYLLP